MQSPASGCSTQTWTQGLSIRLAAPDLVGHRALRSRCPSRSSEALQDIARRHVVDDLGATLARGVGLEQRAFGGDGGQALVPEGDGQRGQPREVAREGAGRLRARPLAAVHVARQAEDEVRRCRRPSAIASSRGGVDGELGAPERLAAARRSCGCVSETATPMVSVPRSSPISARPDAQHGGEGGGIVDAASGSRRRPPRPWRRRRRSASAAGSPAKVSRASARIAAASSRAAEHAERADEPRPVLGRAAPSAASRSESCATMPAIISWPVGLGRHRLAPRRHRSAALGRPTAGAARCRRSAHPAAARRRSAPPAIRRGSRRSRGRRAGLRRRAADQSGKARSGRPPWTSASAGIVARDRVRRIARQRARPSVASASGET